MKYGSHVQPIQQKHIIFIKIILHYENIQMKCFNLKED